MACVAEGKLCEKIKKKNSNKESLSGNLHLAKILK